MKCLVCEPIFPRADVSPKEHCVLGWIGAPRLLCVSVCVRAVRTFLLCGDILTGPQKFKGLFKGLRFSFRVRFRLGLGLGM